MDECGETLASGSHGAAMEAYMEADGAPSTFEAASAMPSLMEVQRIIGLSLTKIQAGRNQRGGLPLHKNLLVATVLNKARDVYMQETMVFNYKMAMSAGQFGMLHQAAAMAANNEESDDNNDNNNNNGAVAVAAAAAAAAAARCPVDDEVAENNSVAFVNTSAMMAAMHFHQQQQQQQQQQPQFMQQMMMQQHHDPQGAYEGLPPPPPPATPPVASNKAQDEGFIDEPDCESEEKGFVANPMGVEETREDEALDTREDGDGDGEGDEEDEDEEEEEEEEEEEIRAPPPFQYCCNCARFHTSHGPSRGPTLVPSHACVSSSSATSTTPTLMMTSPLTTTNEEKERSVTTPFTTLFDLDSQSTFRRDAGSEERVGSKRRRRSLCVESHQEGNGNVEGNGNTKGGNVSGNQVDRPTKRRRRSLSHGGADLDSHNTAVATGSSSGECVHPAFRGDRGNSMEIEQITSLVSIFSFGHHIMAAAAAASSKAAASEAPGPEKRRRGGGGGGGGKRCLGVDDSGVGIELEEHESQNADESKVSVEESDDESDTSSDSGHSSEDHDHDHVKQTPSDTGQKDEEDEDNDNDVANPPLMMA